MTSQYWNQDFLDQLKAIFQDQDKVASVRSFNPIQLYVVSYV